MICLRFLCRNDRMLPSARRISDRRTISDVATDIESVALNDAEHTYKGNLGPTHA